MAKPRGPVPPLPRKPKDELPVPADPAAKAQGDELAEVERALSILQGRHPEHVRAERETQQALEARRAVTRAEAAAEQKAVRRKVVRNSVVGATIVLAVGAVAWTLRDRMARAREIDAALGALSAPYVADGFAAVSRDSLAARDRVQASVVAPSCFVALAVGHDPRLQIERGAGALSGDGSIAWCSCGADNAVATALEAEHGGAVALLVADARAVGGTYGLPFLDPRPNLIADADDCSSEQLDSWLATRPAPPPKNPWVDNDPNAKGLALRGFAPLVAAESREPFAVVPSGHPGCLIALSAEGGDTLSLRLAGEQRPISHAQGPIAWCDSAGTAVTIWREGAGSVHVFVAPPERIGGLLGARKVTEDAGLHLAATWLNKRDLGWDATAMLRATGIAVSEVTIALDAVPHARVAALSVTKGTFGSDASGPSVSPCAPKLSPDIGAMCVESEASSWHLVGGVGEGAAAQGPLPFWMQVYAPVADADALATELSLLTLARRLSALGFQPTVDGFADLPDGVDVAGRAGDTAVVAVGVVPEWPWAFPYTDGPSWKLDEEPRIVPLTPGGHAQLTSTPPPSGPRSTRRTVVFRKSG